MKLPKRRGQILHAYLDLAIGHPVQMELVVDMRGQFRDHDRMLITLRLDTALPGTRQ